MCVYVIYCTLHYYLPLDDSGYSSDGNFGSYDLCDVDSDAESVSSLIDTRLKISTRIDNLRSMIEEVSMITYSTFEEMYTCT